MKLRIRGNALRVRLSRGEVQSLAEQGVVEDRLEFPGGGRLVYRLRAEKNITGISAGYSGNIIEVLVPETLAGQWCGTDLVTLTGLQPVAAGELRVVVEKDFACLAPRDGEDESDNFPHPDAASARSC
jgi:hypothetical protein